MTPETLEAIARRREVGLPDNAPWAPLPGPQEAAFFCQADELFFGGSPGGGKTFLAMGLALTHHWRSIIFRREYKQLLNIVDELKKILGEDHGYNGQDHVFKPPSGRQVELGAMQFEGDWLKYQGRPHDLVVVDEAPHFTLTQYKNIQAWKRSERSGQRVRTVATGNPPTSSDGRWVIGYWAPWLDPNHPRPAQPGELRWFAVDSDGNDREVTGPEPFTQVNKRTGKTELVRPTSRTFIPSSYRDNPHYSTAEYERTLQALPEPMRTIMLEGRFDLVVEDDPWQVFPTAWIEAAMARWTPEGHGGRMVSSLGVDVARGGADQFVISPRHGRWFAPLVKIPGAMVRDGQTGAAHVIAARGSAPARVNVDVIGVGSAVVDICRMQGLQIEAVNFASGSSATDKSGMLGFLNLRAERYWKFREALDPMSGMDIALPPDPELRADLAAQRYEVTMRGIKLREKEEVKVKLGRSPDCSDAVVLTDDCAAMEAELSAAVSAPRVTPRSGADW